MIEDEAKTKWCPMVHVRAEIMFFESPDGEANRKRIDAAEIEHKKSMCIGSQCMMWRYYTTPTAWKKVSDDLYLPCEYADGGYCGLAGKLY